jgi:hypothetical protein
VRFRWLAFLGYHKYLIGDDGSVWSRCVKGPRGGESLCRKWRRLKPGTDTYGYLQVGLCGRGGKVRTWKVHRLVLLAFVGPCPKGWLTRHLDGNRVNNNLENLQWGTPAENVADRVGHGTDPAGERNPNAKLSWEDVKECRERSNAGETYAALAREYGVSATAVSWAVRGRNWKRSG